MEENLETNDLKVNLWKTEVLVSGGNIIDGLSKRKVCPYGDCGLRVKANSVLYVQRAKSIHTTCAKSEDGGSKCVKKFCLQEMCK